MAKFPRFDLAGTPQHFVQRNDSRVPCFPDHKDRRGICRTFAKHSRVMVAHPIC
jgi:hypothetical protein